MHYQILQLKRVFWSISNIRLSGTYFTDANGNLAKRVVHVYGTFRLTEITHSSVMLTDT